jgi:hypothetical protein
LHFDVPVVHDVVPTLHALPVGQAFPDAQVAHIPALQTLSVPHAVPSARFVPVSTHSTAGEQTVVPP